MATGTDRDPRTPQNPGFQGERRPFQRREATKPPQFKVTYVITVDLQPSFAEALGDFILDNSPDNTAFHALAWHLLGREPGEGRRYPKKDE